MSDDTNPISPVLPDTEELEKFVLGGCLAFGDQAVLECFGEISEADFWFPPHRALAKALHGLVNAGLPVDPASVMLQWGNYGQGARPDQLIAEAPDLCPSQGAALMAAKELGAKAARRRLIQASAKSLALLQDEKVSCDEALAPLGDTKLDTKGSEAFTGMQLARAYLSDLEERHQNQGQLQGVSTGFRRMDRLTGGLQRGTLTTVGARTSQGKSAMLLSVTATTVFKHGLPVLFVSLEMSIEQMLPRLAGYQTGIAPVDHRDGRIAEGDIPKVHAFAKALATSPLFMEYCPGINSYALSSLIRRHVLRNNVALVVVDYLQKVRPSGRHAKRNEQVAEVSNQLQADARRNRVPILTAAQLGRAVEHEDRFPRLSDLRECGDIEQDSDLVWLLHFPNRADQPQDCKLVLAKQRGGQTGLVDIRFNELLAKFEDSPVVVE